jgi:hypothetical protein
MDVRASDAERDATVDQLREAAAEGRLTFEELADRIELAAHAVTRGELAPLIADLPTALTLQPAEPIRVRTSGDIKRSGSWVVPTDSSFRSYFGNVKLDLRDATITAQEIHIDAFTPFGNVDLLVPEGVHVDVRANARLGKLKLQTTAAVPGAPRIVLSGGTFFGNVMVRHKRLWEKLLKGG